MLSEYSGYKAEEILGHSFFRYDNGEKSQYICLETKAIKRELAEALIPLTKQMSKITFIEQGFHDQDDLKINLVETLKSFNKNIIIEIVL